MGGKPAKHGLDKRERAVVEHARFFKPYKSELRGLFVALGREHEWSDDPREMLPYLRAKWIGVEHGNATTKDQFTDDQVTAALPYLDAMGLRMADMPRRNTHFDQAVIVGGTMLSNYRRVEFIHEIMDRGIKIDKLVFWVGRRPMEKRDGKKADLFEARGKFRGLGVRSNTWVRDLIQRGVLRTRGKVMLNETDLGRLALLKVIDNKMMPYRIDLSVLNERNRRVDLLNKIEESPERYIEDYYFRIDDGFEIVLLNGAPVDRGIGSDGKPRPPRHTTASCTVEWLQRHAPSKGAKVLYVTGNPHTLRTAQDSYAKIKELGRDDILLTIAGTSPNETTDIQTYLGEIARLIDNDVRCNYR